MSLASYVVKLSGWQEYTVGIPKGGPGQTCVSPDFI